MQYLGGKSRIAKDLAELIDSIREPGQWVWDAFCGGLSMSVALSKKGPVLSTDANAALINLYLAVQQGWDPPCDVSREQHAEAMLYPETDPRKALIGFGCSFGGCWFESYAGGFNGPLTYSQLARRNVLREIEALRGSCFACVDFVREQPKPVSAVLYLDPPYAGTATYKGVSPFNHEAFYERCRQWAAFAHVFISEYAFPFGHCVWDRTSRGTFGLKSGKVHTERLYYLPKGSRW